MNKSTKTLVGVVLFLAIVLVAVGYAAITTIPLNITGSAQAEANQDNFSVIFTGETSTDGDGTTVATKTGDTSATMTVTGLTAKGEKATATYTIQNTSADLSAALSATVTNNSNPDYFAVTKTIADPTTLVASGMTTITVEVELLKTPVAETEEQLKATIGIGITADPVQP